jgi:hypothetical protein
VRWHAAAGAGVEALAAALETYPVCLLFPVGFVDQVQELPFRELVPTWGALRRFTGEEDVPIYDAGMVPDFEHHASLVQTVLALLDEADQARFTAKTAISRADVKEAERKQVEHADQAISTKYTLRHLRRRIREAGATPPDLPPALHDVDQPESEHTTTEDRL